VTATPVASPLWKHLPHLRGGDRRYVQPPTQAGAARGPRHGEGTSLLPRLVGGRHHVQPRGSPEPHPQPGSVPAGGRPGHRERAVLEGADGRRQQPQHPLRAHSAPVGDQVGSAAAQHDAVLWRRAGQARPAPRADRPASLVWHARQFPQGNAHLRGGGILGCVPRHPWAAMLRPWRSPITLTSR
jgi:hypothetical protein